MQSSANLTSGPDFGHHCAHSGAYSAVQAAAVTSRPSARHQLAAARVCQVGAARLGHCRPPWPPQIALCAACIDLEPLAECKQPAALLPLPVADCAVRLLVDRPPTHARSRSAPLPHDARPRAPCPPGGPGGGAPPAGHCRHAGQQGRRDHAQHHLVGRPRCAAAAACAMCRSCALCLLPASPNCPPALPPCSALPPAGRPLRRPPDLPLGAHGPGGAGAGGRAGDCVHARQGPGCGAGAADCCAPPAVHRVIGLLLGRLLRHHFYSTNHAVLSCTPPLLPLSPQLSARRGLCWRSRRWRASTQRCSARR